MLQGQGEGSVESNAKRRRGEGEGGEEGVKGLGGQSSAEGK